MGIDARFAHSGTGALGRQGPVHTGSATGTSSPHDAQAPAGRGAGAPGHTRTPLPYGSSPFGLFGEVLVVGLVVFVLSIPLITAAPALAAGVRHLRRHLRGEKDRLVDLLWLFTQACRGAWILSAGVLAAGLILGFNVWLWRDGGQVPITGMVSAVLLVALAVVVLRSAGGWQPGSPWLPAALVAFRRAVSDLRGSTMLVLALGLIALMVWMLLPLALVAGGLLALAILAVERAA